LLGVVPEHYHAFTRNDLLSKNVDLINRAASLISSLPKRKLKVTLTSQTSTQLVFTLDTQGLERIDIYGDDRPEGSLKVSNQVIDLTVPKRGFAQYQFRAYTANKLVATKRFEV
jgi:hypothetical protein